MPRIRDHFTILFAGSLYNHPVIEVFCDALELACAADADLRRALRIQIVGRSKNGAFDALRHHAAKRGLLSQISFTEWQPQERLRQLVESCHAQLCFDFDEYGSGMITPGKLAKLIACGRPVLAIAVPDGETWKVVRDTQAGVTADHENADAVASAITRIFRCGLNGESPSDRREDILESYSFRHHASTLSDLFDLACKKEARKSDQAYLTGCSHPQAIANASQVKGIQLQEGPGVLP